MTPGTSTFFLSDFHAGHRQTHRDRKFRALDAIATMARKRNVGDIVLAGDIADERADKQSIQEDCAVLRDAIKGYASVFLRGNHDDAAFFDTAEMEELLQCRIDERPWHVSAVSGVVATHGHHFRTPSIRRALKLDTAIDHLNALLNNHKTVRHHKAMTKGFSFAGRFGDRLGTVGIPATDMYEYLEQVSQRSRNNLAAALRRKCRPSPYFLLRERLADMIDLRSIRHAARLARTMRSWGVASGHTHVPGLYVHRLEDEVTGEKIPFLVGNSGSFVSRYAPTFIEVHHPGMTLWQYDEDRHSMVVLQKMELTPKDLETQTRFFNCV